MKDIAIYGAGGFGREVACLLSHINKSSNIPKWNLVGFFDDGKKKGESNEYGIILGNIDDLNNWNKPLSIVIAVGHPKIMKFIVERINNPLIEFPNLIAPDVIIFDKCNFFMGRGNIISFGCTLSCNVHLGDFNVLNCFISLGHDTVLGNFNSLMPNVRISGEVKIGDENFFGVSSVVLQQIKIGCQTVVGANSLIIRKTKDGETYMGNPASVVKY